MESVYQTKAELLQKPAVAEAVAVEEAEVEEVEVEEVSLQETEEPTQPLRMMKTENRLTLLQKMPAAELLQKIEAPEVAEAEVELLQKMKPVEVEPDPLKKETRLLLPLALPELGLKPPFQQEEQVLAQEPPVVVGLVLQLIQSELDLVVAP